MNMPVQETANVMLEVVLNAFHRCDKCKAQAYVMTLHSGNPLHWCGHCYSRNESLLSPHMYVDERQRLATT